MSTITLSKSSVLFKNESSDLFLEPSNSGYRYFHLAYHHTSGAALMGYSTLGIGCFLLQTVASVVAVPFKILGGVFYYCSHAVGGDFDQGRDMLVKEMRKAKEHVILVVSSPIVSAEESITLLRNMPYILSTWNKQIHWWHGIERRVKSLVSNEPTFYPPRT